MTSETLDERLKLAHDQAVLRGEDSYIDPISGYQVFTAEYHKKRGYCCQSGCRHCPYGFIKKPGLGLFKKNK
jgi:hypothetical protein